MTFIAVEKARVANNIERIKERIGKADIIAVLKSDAYGLGLKSFAEVLREQGIRRFAVSDPQDAQHLRDWGFSEEELLILRSTACENDINAILSSCATATVGSAEAAVTLNGIAESQGVTCDIHIKIDTGMGRYGFLPTELEKILTVFRYMKNLNVTGMYTHYANAFCSKKKTQAQYDTFMQVVQKVRDSGCEPGTLHASNSAAVFGCKVPELDAVRVGSSLSGRVLVGGDFGLQRVGFLHSYIVDVRWVAKGQSIGYGSAFTAKRPTKIAVVPVGTCDGFMLERARDVFSFKTSFRSALSAVYGFLKRKKIYLTVGGRRAQVLGHIGTTHTIIDVTELDCDAGTAVSFECAPLYLNPRIERRYE